MASWCMMSTYNIQQHKLNNVMYSFSYVPFRLSHFILVVVIFSDIKYVQEQASRCGAAGCLRDVVGCGIVMRWEREFFFSRSTLSIWGAVSLSRLCCKGYCKQVHNNGLILIYIPLRLRCSHVADGQRNPLHCALPALLQARATEGPGGTQDRPAGTGLTVAL